MRVNFVGKREQRAVSDHRIGCRPKEAFRFAVSPNDVSSGVGHFFSRVASTKSVRDAWQKLGRDGYQILKHVSERADIKPAPTTVDFRFGSAGDICGHASMFERSPEADIELELRECRQEYGRAVF